MSYNLRPHKVIGGDCTCCKGSHETPAAYRSRLRNKTTRLMAEMRGDKVQDDDTILVGHNGGDPYWPEGQLQTTLASMKKNLESTTAATNERYSGGPASRGYGVRLKRVIAVGGYGIAALVDYMTGTGERKECVMKLEKSRHIAHDFITREETALQKYQGAKHIVQIIDDATQGIKNERRADHAGKRPLSKRVSDEERDGVWNIDRQRDRNFILTEFVPGGNLDSWLTKASRTNEAWPDKALWMLLKCLISGLVGIAYPPKAHHSADHPNWDPSDSIDEYIPRPGVNMERTVHFDLDPQNILVGKDETHGNFPIFKIADFGNVQFFDELRANPAKFQKKFFWMLRSKGKKWFYAPEQFDRAWDGMSDFVENTGPNQFVATDGTKPAVAGNYGMHTNIYQIGVIMWCAITQCAYTKPVVAMDYPDFNNPQPGGIKTYGGALQAECLGAIDAKLREIVQLCMAHDPVDRPTLAQLVKTIDNRLASNDLETDAEVSEWAQKFFSIPDSADQARKRPAPHRDPNGNNNGNGGDDENGNNDDGGDDEKRYAPRQRTGKKSEKKVPRTKPKTPSKTPAEQQFDSMEDSISRLYPSPALTVFPQSQPPQPPAPEDIFNAFGNGPAFNPLPPAPTSYPAGQFNTPYGQALPGQPFGSTQFPEQQQYSIPQQQPQQYGTHMPNQFLQPQQQNIPQQFGGNGEGEWPQQPQQPNQYVGNGYDLRFQHQQQQQQLERLRQIQLQHQQQNGFSDQYVVDANGQVQQPEHVFGHPYDYNWQA